MTVDPLASWADFTAAAAARLEAGRREYGDRSFSLAPDELAREVEEELFDVAAWSFILWTRIRALREAVKATTPTRSTKDTRSTTYTFHGGE